MSNSPSPSEATHPPNGIIIGIIVTMIMMYYALLISTERPTSRGVTFTTVNNY